MARRRNLRWINRIRALGRGIGAGSSNDPRDGDGDGFYSPKPGMPDKTPVPSTPEMSSGVSGIGTTPNAMSVDSYWNDNDYYDPRGTYSPESQRKAHAAALENQQKVLTKHGDVRKKSVAIEALKKAFPNVRLQFESVLRVGDFFAGEKEDLSEAKFNHVVGLLHMAEKYPKVASKIISLRTDSFSTEQGGYSQTDGDVDTGDFRGYEIGLNPDLTATRAFEILGDNPSDFAAPWGYLMVLAMRDSQDDFSLEDMNRVVQQAIAMHEYGHAMHSYFGLSWHTGNAKDKKIPLKLYKKALLRELQIFADQEFNNYVDEGDFEDLWTMIAETLQRRAPINDPENDYQRTLQIMWNLLEAFAREQMDYPDDQEKLVEFFMNNRMGKALESEWAWDGEQNERKRGLIRRQLAKVSSYGGLGSLSNPASQYQEATVETISAMQLGYEPKGDEGQNHIDDILTKVDKNKVRFDRKKIREQLEKNSGKRYDIPLPSACRGYSAEPLPSAPKPRTPRKLKGKALGAPIGGSDEPQDGDNDGKYTAFPGGEDNIPMPPESGKEVVEWDNVADIINFDVFPERITDLDPDDAAYDVRQQGVDAWGMWGACRSIRKAAYRLAGLSPDTKDPNIERQGGYFGGGWEVAEDDDQITEYARFFMAELVVGARGGYSGNRRSLFRAVDVDGDEREGFEKAMSKGSIVDIPLLATADRRSQGLKEYLTRYGKDYLIEIEDGAESAEAGAFDPMWSRRDEDDTLNRIEGLAQSIQDEIDAGYFDDDKDEKKEREKQVKLLRHLVAVYERKREEGSQKRAKAREELAEAVSDYFGGDPEGTFEDGEGLNWEGEFITEDDGEAFWEAYDSLYMGGYSETQPREHITGGRFEVLEVAEDPEGVYGKIIKLRQIGVFDPQNPGLVVPKVKKG